MSERVRKALLVVAILTLVVSGGLLARTLYDRAAARGEMSEIQEVARPVDEELPSLKTTDGTKYPSFRPLSTEALDALSARNSQFIGWLTIPGTNIDLPLVQAKDNTKYLNTTFEGNRRSAGSVFLDNRASARFESMNSVLYGHNMKDKTMFYDLTRMREQRIFDAVPHAFIQRPDGSILVYEFFSIYAADPEYDYRKPEYSGTASTSFIKRMSDKSSIKTQITVEPTDKILTFSTCVYDFRDARLVLHARLVEVVPATE